ncbi:outer membrane beta-barrel family protein [uncultured Maribacter sp.]|uniref:outer membrane beta-barrel family protein n=1 Tax=uncultured Maribacter sp. TaxID=431308 RepID=UPI00262C7CC2|nr:outer membrane beta-barrel family protein [uncultured Maribacter sp.]
MKKVIFLFAIFLYSTISAKNANPDLTTGSVSGKVTDQLQNSPIAYAAIVIKSSDGSNTITGGITEDNGSFEIKKIIEGTYNLEVQYIGYKTYTTQITISKKNKKINLGIITLEEESQQLTGVEVVAERTTIEQKIDRKVINVGKDLTTAGASASDIMNNIPSVNVDSQSGELSLRGNSNVRVMVDGKLSNVPVAQLLKQIPSTSIKSIELITNPSAKYNPEGMSGIINIVLHKNANIGFNGTLNLGLNKGRNAKFNSSVDLNYRNGKFNLYGNYGNNIGKNNNRGFLYRHEENSEQLFKFFNNNKSHLYKIGVDFYLNDKNTISLFTNQNKYDGKDSGATDIIYYDDLNRNTAQLFSNSKDNLSEQYNFDYKLDFKKEGHNIELEVDYNEYNNDEDADFNFSGNSITPNYKDFVNTRRTQKIANLDYVNPIDSISKLELGIEARVFETNVGYNSTGVTFNQNGNLRPTPDADFIYGMDIYSAYATFGQNYNKWSYQVGLRVEDVEVKADTNTVRSFTDKYTEFYPSGFLKYSPTDKNQFQLSYSRRIDRPGLGQVNPIREWSTPLISSLGNPSLKPQFTNSYEINYTRRLGKGSITTGLFYRAIKDEISRAVSIDRLDLNKMILSFNNFDDTSSYGLEISANYKATKWWSLNGSFDLYSQTQRGITERLLGSNSTATIDDIIVDKVEIKNTAWNARLSNSFKATKKLTFQVFGFYRGANENIQFKVKPMYFVNTGARYSFAEGKGTLSFNYNDIFNTMRFAFDSETPFTQNGQFNWESRSAYVGLSYMFGSGKNRASKRKRRDSNTKQGGGGLL